MGHLMQSADCEACFQGLESIVALKHKALQYCGWSQNPEANQSLLDALGHVDTFFHHRAVLAKIIPASNWNTIDSSLFHWRDKIPLIMSSMDVLRKTPLPSAELAAWLCAGEQPGAEEKVKLYKHFLSEYVNTFCVTLQFCVDAVVKSAAADLEAGAAACVAHLAKLDLQSPQDAMVDHKSKHARAEKAYEEAESIRRMLGVPTDKFPGLAGTKDDLGRSTQMTVAWGLMQIFTRKNISHAVKGTESRKVLKAPARARSRCDSNVLCAAASGYSRRDVAQMA